MKLKTNFSMIIVAAFGAALVACGGGSVSTGGGGSGGGDVTSSLVVEVSGDGRTAALHGGSGAESRVASAIADLLISKALAQTAGVAIFIDGKQVAVTDETGSAVIPLAAGTYELCILNLTNPDNCTTVNVEPDSVVVVSGVNIEDDGSVTFGSVDTERAEDNIVAFQDPNNANKTLVCHKAGPFKQFTISVGTPAALTGHQAHGDSLGPCPEETQVSDDDQNSDDSSGDDSRGGPPEGVPGPPGGFAGNDDDDSEA